MPSPSTWLATLLRVREHRHDAALQSLAQSLHVAKSIRDVATDVEAKLSQLGQALQHAGQSGRLDSDRIRQLRQDRDVLRIRQDDLRSQQTTANAAVRQAQTDATAKDAEAEILRRLRDRLDYAHQQTQRRREEQTPLEIALSLCNGQLSG